MSAWASISEPLQTEVLAALINQASEFATVAFLTSGEHQIVLGVPLRMEDEWLYIGTENGSYERSLSRLSRSSIVGAFPLRVVTPENVSLPRVGEDVWEGLGALLPDFLRRSKLKFSETALLYCDWDHLRAQSSGLNNIGVWGVSFGWVNSLSAQARALLSRAPVELRDLSATHGVVAFRAHVSFLEKRRMISLTTPNRYYDEPTLIVGGTTWHFAMASANPFGEREGRDQTWQLICFREDALIYPQSLLETVSDPLILAGDVVPKPYSCVYGDRQFFIMVRAAAAVGLDGR